MVNRAAPPTSELLSTGRGILILAHLSRATRGTIGRLQAQAFRDFLLPFRLAKGAASLHAPAKRFQFLRVVSISHPSRFTVPQPSTRGCPLALIAFLTDSLAVRPRLPRPSRKATDRMGSVPGHR